MSTALAVASRLLVLGLTLALAIYATVAYPLHLVAGIAAATLLLVAIVALGRHFYDRRPGRLPDLLGLFVMMFSATDTLHTITAREVYGPLRAIDATPGYALAAYALHFLIVAAVVLAGRERSRLVGLGAAIVYSSTFYLPTFATPEMGASFVPLLALALALLATEPSPSQPTSQRRHRLLLLPLTLFGLVALIASLASHSPSESLAWLLKLLTLGLLMLSAPLIVRTRSQWKLMAILVAAMSVAVPVLLSAAKLMELSWQLSGRVLVEYKLGLNELGGANLIARAVLSGAPLPVALAITAARHGWRLLWWALNFLALLVFATCQSWGGAIALALTCVFAGLLAYGTRWRAWWQGQVSGPVRPLIYAAVLIVSVAGLWGLIQLAPQTNVGSFNGRLFQFRAAAREMLDHPLLGVGPGHYHVKSSYTTGLGWLVDTQQTLDQPLKAVFGLRGSTTLHHHNLFLEIGVGVGLLGLAAFLWFLVELFRSGLIVRAQLHRADRILLTGCVACIFASAAWGLLDVMEISPPFFSFPVWALAGLVLAATQAFGIEPGRGESRNWAFARLHSHWLKVRPRPSVRVAQALRLALLSVLTIVGVFLPLAGNLYYKRGYTAYQEQRWTEAVNELLVASRFEPLSAKYHQLRGEALINLGRYHEATAAYEQAAALKQEFAPYYAQLGWLAWLQGDLELATDHFERAVDMDPREAWRDGLHADLGLAYAAQGRIEDASLLLGETIRLDPQMADAAYWVPVLEQTGRIEVVLDPVYLGGPSLELEKRILAHLGRTDYTLRLFAPEHSGSSPITVNSILDGIEEEYQAALEEESREAPRLLATVAEAARAVGLEGRAERTYLAFQATFPESAYGFRYLGMLYQEQGHLQEAQEQLEDAVNVSPRDTASWLQLARVYLAEEMLDEAQATLDTVYRQEPLEPDLYELRAQLHLKRGEVALAADALGKALVIEESIPNRLALADLYRRLDQPQQAAKQCTKAADALLRTWPRPLDPRLWEIGLCLAQSPGVDTDKEIARIARAHPLPGNVLLGHLHRARGELDQALTAYQAATEARPDEGAPHYFLGETYQALGQPELAETEYRQAAALDPLESLPLLAQGRMEWGMGQREAALESFRAAVEATPGWGQAHVALGNALLALGDLEGAAEHYQLAQLADRDFQEGLVHDLAAQLGAAQIKAPDAGYVKNDYLTIDGHERRVLFMHPDSLARYTLQVPEGGSLAFDLATSPESWGQPGDGVTFSVYVESDQGTEQVFSAYIDPKHEGSDRRWHPHTVDLSDYARQTVTVVFETTGGPAGDNRFDWAGWGTPRLLAP